MTTGAGQDIHSLKYMPQLDGLRALAILAILYDRLYPAQQGFFGIYWGGLGVRCFFVLSGFLITSILLRELANAPSFKDVYAGFISRRMLRLYPVLLVALLVGAIIGLDRLRETLPWTLTFLTNIYAAKIGAWPGSVAHLYTVAVIAQFYLIWPIVLFIVPRRLLPPVLVAIVVCSLLFRLILRGTGFEVASDVLTPGCFDALALGALLALMKNDRRLISIIGIAGICIWFVANALGWFGTLTNRWFYVANADIALTAAAMVFVWVVGRAADGFDGIVGRILSNPELRYLGLISYGIYIFHNFTLSCLDLFGLKPLLATWQFNLLVVAITILLASLSWHFLEQPLMRLGRKKLAARSRPGAYAAGQATTP